MPRTRAVAVATDLRRMIQTGELAAGTPLRQDALAERFGVSITPVREALAVLSREGLIRYDVHRGAVVFPPTPDDIRENFEIRLALEPLATRLAAPRLDDEDFQDIEDLAGRLREIVDDPETAVASGTYEQLDRAFHGRIFTAAGRPRLAGMIETLRDASAAYAHLYATADDPAQLLLALQAQHDQLLAALRDSDAGRASQVAAEHVWLTGVRHGFEPDGSPPE